jgi:hypothetical protein
MVWEGRVGRRECVGGSGGGGLFVGEGCCSLLLACSLARFSIPAYARLIAFCFNTKTHVVIFIFIWNEYGEKMRAIGVRLSGLCVVGGGEEWDVVRA